MDCRDFSVVQLMSEFKVLRTSNFNVGLECFRILEKIRVWQASQEIEVRSMGFVRLTHI